jgi:predicted outer membrane repeat protein
MRRMALIWLLSVLAFASVSPARTWYVKPDGTGDVPTIQAGVDSVAPGDTVMLASGIYTGTGNYNVVVMEDGFVICSETGDPEDCIIDCEGHLGYDRRGFDFQASSWGPQTVIRGITIRNSNVMYSGAILSEGTMMMLTIEDCVFESNVAGSGGGAVALVDVTAMLTLGGCFFVSNEALSGGAVFIAGSGMLQATIDSCVFYDNQAVAGGAIHFPYHEVDADITNSLFIENSAVTDGGAILVESINIALVENCTFYANHAPTGSAIRTSTFEWGESITDVRNCIIAYGTGGEGYYQSDWVPDDRSMQCTDIYGNEGGDFTGGLAGRLGADGNFSACPSFCGIEMAPHDLSLCSGSPCLPGNHPDEYDCGLVGALGEGCTCGPTRSRPIGWGGIKALFR